MRIDCERSPILAGRKILAAWGPRQRSAPHGILVDVTSPALRLVSRIIEFALWAVALGGIGWMVSPLFLWSTEPSLPPDRTVVVEQPSPSGAHIATLIQVSGGGAAGYVYEELLLGSRCNPARRIAERLYGAQLTWLDDHDLRVEFFHSTYNLSDTQVDGITVSYHQAQ